MPPNLVNFAFCHDDEKKIVLGTIDDVCIMDLVYKSNHKPALDAKIDPMGRHIDVGFANAKLIETSMKGKVGSEKILDWVKGMRVDTANDVIMSWSVKRLTFSHLSASRAGKLVFEVAGLLPSENSITDVILSSEYRYYLTGT